MWNGHFSDRISPKFRDKPVIIWLGAPEISEGWGGGGAAGGGGDAGRRGGGAVRGFEKLREAAGLLEALNLLRRVSTCVTCGGLLYGIPVLVLH